MAGQPVEQEPPPTAGRAAGVDWGRRVETAVKDQAVDVRRFIVASLDSFASRIVSDVRDSMPAPTRGVRRAAGAAAAQPAWPWVAGIAAACLVAVAFAAVLAGCARRIGEIADGSRGA